MLFIAVYCPKSTSNATAFPQLFYSFSTAFRIQDFILKAVESPESTLRNFSAAFLQLFYSFSTGTWGGMGEGKLALSPLHPHESFPLCSMEEAC